jgi:TetR/AcrR family transcriptional regulator, regulator of cefoperazone and chloramphenicol sensitivity
MPTRDDQETRDRLLQAAAKLFSERGYKETSIRDICADAEANVASVNYYFHDKWGLYKELLEVIIEDARRMQQLAHESRPGASPKEKLRKYVLVFLSHGLGEGKQSWRGRLMGREMVDPTPGLDLFIEQVIRPNSERVAGLVAELIGCDTTDPRVGPCVGSIQTQIVGYFGPVVPRLVPGLKFTPEVIAAIADHITEFTLGGIHAIAQKKVEVQR